MKITIKYEIGSLTHRPVASTTVDGKNFMGHGAKWDEARTDVLRQIELYQRRDRQIPEDEEVDIDDV